MIRWVVLSVFLIVCEACHPKIEPVTTTTVAPTTPSTTEATTGPPCPDGWTQSDRNAGTWCLQMVDLTDKTYTGAQTACAALGGVVSSAETPTEMTLIFSLRLQPYSYIILGAQLTADCPCTGSIVCPATATCTTRTAYDWTDGFVTGRDVFDAAPAASFADTLYYSPGIELYVSPASSMSSIGINAICGKQGM